MERGALEVYRMTVVIPLQRENGFNALKFKEGVSPGCGMTPPQNNQISRRWRREPHNQSNTNDFPRSTSFGQEWPEEKIWEPGGTDPVYVLITELRPSWGKCQKTTCEMADQVVWNGLMNNTQKPFQNMIQYAMLFCAVFTSNLGHAADPIGFTVSDTAFEAPADWKKAASTSPMRKAQFAVVREGIQDKGEVVFYHFGPGAVGGTQANVQRWLGQFKETGDQLGAKTTKPRAAMRRARR